MNSFLKGLALGAALFISANAILTSAHADSLGQTAAPLCEKCH
jgi:hypothetical protein